MLCTITKTPRSGSNEYQEITDKLLQGLFNRLHWAVLERAKQTLADVRVLEISSDFSNDHMTRDQIIDSLVATSGISWKRVLIALQIIELYLLELAHFEQVGEESVLANIASIGMVTLGSKKRRYTLQLHEQLTIKQM